ncbi:Rib/alpha-like domain-containing protein [Corynebacterium sp. P5848]|uniref:Rib/alpha-like domain-containing protein n=1 Tax=Corynebacterium marambiense TaxID=2765364 RepID=UPI002260CB9F|nr:Rib/alpha-like domain-containing protein [Corynebacterium marambiense]MCX7543498.1 Rib/alpha-like domain-containing protein [Corynebacterium marambiense]
MAQSSRRMSRAGLAAIVCLSLTLSPISPVGVALADATYTKGVEATDGARQVYAAETDALHWGVNEMFRGKATSFEAADGARYDVEAKQFVFPYVSMNDAAKTVSYTGSVTILGECEDAADPSRGTCKVDVTLTDPVVTVDPDGTSSVSATVHSTKDGAEWFGPETVELATLDFSGARFNNSDTDTTWVDVAATATDAAADNAFLGTGALENVEFTYPGETEENQSTEISVEKYSAAETDLSIGDMMETIEFDDGTVLQVADHYGIDAALFNADHSESVSVTGIESILVVADTATKTLYWIDDNNVIKTGALGDDGSITGTAEFAQLGETGHVTGFARQSDGTLGIVLVPKYNTEPTYARIVEITAAGEKTVTGLPSAKELHPEIDDSGEYYTDEAYGLSFGDDRSLDALPDGTWIFNHDYEVTEGKGATPIHITPKADVKASLLTGAADLFADFQVVRGLYANGDIVAFYNARKESDANKHTVVGFYRYADGELTPIYTNTAAAEFETIGGVGTDGDSLYILSSANKTLTALSAADGTVQDSVVLDEATEIFKYSNTDYNNLISTGDKVIVTVPKDGDRWGNNHTKLATISKTMSGMTADSTVERVTVGEYNDATRYEPTVDDTAVEATVGTPVTTPAPTFDMVVTDEIEMGTAPTGTKFYITNDVQGVTVGVNGTVTLNAVETQADTNVVVPVLVVYPDTTTDEYTVTFTVSAAADPIADTGKVFYGKDALTVTAGETGTVAPAFVVDGENKDVPAATFVFEGDVPAGASIGESTGVVTYSPTEATDDVKNIKIRVTFTEDGSTQLSGVSLKAEAATPTYSEQVWYPDAITVAPGETATTTPKLGGIEAESEKKDIPEDFTFRLVKDIAGVSIDSTTGTITYVAPADAAEQTIYPRVEVTFPGGKTQQTGTIINVKKDEPAQSEIRVFYPSTVIVDPGQEAVATPEAATISPYTVVDMPAGTTFKFVDKDDEARPAGMNLNENTGVVTFTPTDDQAGQSYFFYVQATYGDGTTSARPATGLIKVNGAATPEPEESSKYNLFYPNTDVTAGESATSAPYADMAGTDDIEEGKIPTGTTFELAPAGNPEGAVIDENTGVITYTPAADTEAQNVAFSVTATYSDDSTDTAIAVFIVSAAAQQIDDNAKYTPVYANGQVQAGESVAVTPTFDMTGTDTVETDSAPADTTFAFSGAPADGFSIDTGTGAVTYEAPADAGDATVQAMVTVTYADGTKDESTVTVAVKAAEDNTPTPSGSSSLINKLTGSVAGGTKTGGIMGLLSVGVLFAVIAAIIHFLRMQVPGFPRF